MILWYIYLSLLGAILLVSAIRWKHLNRPLKVVVGIIFCTLLTEALRGIVTTRTGEFILHMYVLVELLLSFFYFYFLLGANKRTLLYGGFTFFATAIFILWLVNPGYLWERNYMDCVFLALCISLWSGCFCYELIDRPLQYSLKSDGNFLINCGNLLFYPGTVLLFGFSKYLDQVNPTISHSLKSLNKILNLVLYLLYFIAFCIARNVKKPVDEPAKKMPD